MEIGAHKGVALALGLKALGHAVASTLILIGGYCGDNGCIQNIIALLREIEEPSFRHSIVGPFSARAWLSLRQK